MVEERDVKRRRVRMRCHDVIGQIAVDRRTGLFVVARMLEKRHAHTHDDRAFNLVAPCLQVEDASRIDHGDHAAHAQLRDLRLPRDLGEMHAV